MDLLAIREALAATLVAETGLPVHEVPGAVTSTPAVLMGAPSARYDQSFAGSADITWPVVVVVDRAKPDSLSTLANVLSSGGVHASSVVDAVNTTDPATTVAAWWRVLDFEPWAELQINNASYWSATVNVEVGT